MFKLLEIKRKKKLRQGINYSQATATSALFKLPSTASKFDFVNYRWLSTIDQPEKLTQIRLSDKFRLGQIDHRLKFQTELISKYCRRQETNSIDKTFKADFAVWLAVNFCQTLNSFASDWVRGREGGGEQECQHKDGSQGRQWSTLSAAGLLMSSRRGNRREQRLNSQLWRFNTLTSRNWQFESCCQLPAVCRLSPIAWRRTPPVALALQDFKTVAGHQ